MMMLIAAVIAGCAGVDGDMIRMSDFARAIPAFAAAPQEASAGFSPVFGATRTFSAPEVARFASRFGVELPAGTPVCFQRPSTKLETTAVRESLGVAFTDEKVQFDVVDFARYAVPLGEVIFRRSGLQRTPSPDGTRLWQGKVIYAGRRSYPVWVRVRLSCRREVVVAAGDLNAGQVLNAGDVRVETLETDPLAAPTPVRVEDVAGKLVRSRVSAGKPIPQKLLSAAPLVRSGEEVEVTVYSGQAQLKLAGKARKQGRHGEIIPVRNPSSGRTFPARVDGRGHVVVGGTSEKNN